MEEPQTAVSPFCTSSVWCTDGCVGMTGCLCIHHQCNTCSFDKADREVEVIILPVNSLAHKALCNDLYVACVGQSLKVPHKLIDSCCN